MAKNYSKIIEKNAPESNVIYTFNYFDAIKFKAYSRRFIYSGTLPNGRIQLFDVDDNYFTDMTPSRFSYLVKKCCSKKEYRRVEEPEKPETVKFCPKPVETPGPSIEKCYDNILEQLESYSETTKVYLKKVRGIDIDELIKKVESYTPEELPIDIIVLTCQLPPVEEKNGNQAVFK